MKKILKRDWRIVDSFEKRERRRFLKKLTEKDSFKIFENLYLFSYNYLDRRRLKKIDWDKVKLLACTHSMFNKVKI